MRPGACINWAFSEQESRSTSNPTVTNHLKLKVGSDPPPLLLRPNKYPLVPNCKLAYVSGLSVGVLFCWRVRPPTTSSYSSQGRQKKKKAYSTNIKRMSQFFGAHNYEAALYYITLSMQVCTLPFLKGYRLVIISCVSWLGSYSGSCWMSAYMSISWSGNTLDQRTHGA